MYSVHCNLPRSKYYLKMPRSIKSVRFWTNINLNLLTTFTKDFISKSLSCKWEVINKHLFITFTPVWIIIVYTNSCLHFNVQMSNRCSKTMLILQLTNAKRRCLGRLSCQSFGLRYNLKKGCMIRSKTVKKKY